MARPADCRVAVDVVVALEPVEVEHDQDQRLDTRVGDQRSQPLIERAAISQTREGVRRGSSLDGTKRIGIPQGDRRLAREQARKVELLGAEVGFPLTHSADVEGSRDLAADEERHYDKRLGFVRRARNDCDP